MKTVKNNNMENKHIELMDIGDLKCDAESCDYTERVSAEDHPKYINKPCPKCGANLLTYEDYLRFKASLDAIDMINSMSEDELKELNSIMEMSGQADEIKKMMEAFSVDDIVKVSVSTHNEIKIDSIEKLNSDTSVKECDATKLNSSNSAD